MRVLQVGKSKDKVLDCKEELKRLTNEIPWETGKTSSEIMTLKGIIKTKLQNIPVCRMGRKDTKKAVGKTKGPQREEGSVPEVDIKFDYLE